MEDPGYDAQLRSNLAKVASALAREPERRELLTDGQEEVFSRTEVERGVVEHQMETHRSPGEAEADGEAASRA